MGQHVLRGMGWSWVFTLMSQPPKQGTSRPSSREPGHISKQSPYAETDTTAGDPVQDCVQFPQPGGKDMKIFIVTLRRKNPPMQSTAIPVVDSIFMHSTAPPEVRDA